MSLEDPGAAAIIRELALQAHPEGGWYRETFRDAGAAAGRSHGTAIYYLLAAGETSAWHRVDATEIWHHYAGAPLTLMLSADGRDLATLRLGSNLASGEQPQLVVPAQTWQSARSLGPWTLVGCTVAPGFRFEGFELAPEDFDPERGQERFAAPPTGTPE